MNKYVVNNCPACHDFDVFGIDNKGCCYLYHTYCKDIENCVMKQMLSNNDLTLLEVERVNEHV